MNNNENLVVVHSNGKGVWGDGEMGRWGDGGMGGWGDGECGSVGEIKECVSYHYHAGLSKIFLCYPLKRGGFKPQFFGKSTFISCQVEQL
ncbi:MAG: hypothetical protein F6K23_15715 [Okeania sp. SIO2C9]|uniref:hypothetical protein n=1 Tax=Okeania sp. SIO2C9 TaxID=2607791 RepID=UPI0013BFB485|nr:hypothetical protein [Okeania sp. SIO2C9]NEQ74348.1 hypothetical protein [Okeania sp. SIO2C9]